MFQSTLPLWRQILSENFTRLEDLADFLELSEMQRNELLARPRFALSVPRRLAAKMQKGTLDDPLFRQFVPRWQEKIITPGFVADPVQDASFREAPKLLHKYEGRLLFVATGVCAMHCRYCFRQNFEYEKQDKSFEKELALIAKDPTVNEIILSGGDPLSLSNKTLEELFERLKEIPHLRKIRFHSRFPIGIPERIDAGFLQLIQDSPLQSVFVLHSNHSAEYDEDILLALRSLRRAGALLLNQSVLLRGVNDQLDVLIALSHLLVDNGILPYYLHQLDRVQGAAHFEVSENEGQELIEGMRKKLPGYAVPKYVREEAGKPHKTIL